MKRIAFTLVLSFIFTVASAAVTDRAYSLYQNEEYEAAITEASLVMNRAGTEADLSSKVKALSIIGCCYLELGDEAKAMDMCCQAFKLLIDAKDLSFNQTNVSISSTLYSIAEVYWRNGDFDKAYEYLNRSIIFESSLGRGQSILSQRYDKLIDFQIEQKKYSEAISSIMEAREATNNSNNSFYKAKLDYQSGLCLEALGDSTSAETSFVSAVDHLKHFNVDLGHYLLPLFINKLASYDLDRKDTLAAISHYYDAIDMVANYKNKIYLVDTYAGLASLLRESDPVRSNYYEELVEASSFHPYLEELSSKLAMHYIDFPRKEREQFIRHQRLKTYAFACTAILLLVLLLSALFYNLYLNRLAETRREKYLALEQILKQKEKLLEVTKSIADERVRDEVSMLAEEMGPSVKLTRRESEIAALISEGFLNKEIADHLNISVRTVENHRNSIYHKLGVNNSVGLIQLLKDKLR